MKNKVIGYRTKVRNYNWDCLSGTEGAHVTPFRLVPPRCFLELRMYRVQNSKSAARFSHQFLDLGLKLRMKPREQADHVFRLLGKHFLRHDVVASNGLKSRRVSDIFIEQYVTGVFIEPWFGHVLSPTPQWKGSSSRSRHNSCRISISDPSPGHISCTSAILVARSLARAVGTGRWLPMPLFHVSAPQEMDDL